MRIIPIKFPGARALLTSCIVIIGLFGPDLPGLGPGLAAQATTASGGRGPSLARAPEAPKPAEGVALNPQPGKPLPLDLVFQDEAGRDVTLKSFFDQPDRPVVLVPGYYECPMLCTAVFNEVKKAAAGAAEHKLIPGRDYVLVSFSFSPKEGPELARAKGLNYREALRKLMPPESAKFIDESAWRFLTGNADSINKLLGAAGYQVRPNKDGVNFDHPASVFILTPRGKFSKYLDGLRITQRDFRFGLIDAADGRIGQLLDRVFQFCFVWDDSANKYTLYAFRFVQIGSLLVLLSLATFLIFQFTRHRNK